MMNLDCQWTYTFIMVKYLTQTKVTPFHHSTEQNRPREAASRSPWSRRETVDSALKLNWLSSHLCPNHPCISMSIHGLVYSQQMYYYLPITICPQHYTVDLVQFIYHQTMYLYPDSIQSLVYLPTNQPKVCNHSMHGWMWVGMGCGQQCKTLNQ